MKELIIIGGLASAGKTTLAEALRDECLAGGLSVEMIKFADSLYALQSFIYEAAGLPVVKNRSLLQKLGDAIRETVDELYFVKVTEKVIADSEADVVIIDDMRFPEEAVLARKLNALTLEVFADEEVRRTRGKRLGTWEETNHNSEAGLPPEAYQVRFTNNGVKAARVTRVAKQLFNKISSVPPQPTN